MRRRLIMGGLLAALTITSLASVQPAHAGVGTLTGMGNVTAYANCPYAFKIPLEGTKIGTNRWIFTIAGVHVECMITGGVPITFEGLWNPFVGNASNSPMSCPASTDPTRPGHLCLGSVPTEMTLHITDLRFCVGNRCFEGYAFIERA